MKPPMHLASGRHLPPDVAGVAMLPGRGGLDEIGLPDGIGVSGGGSLPRGQVTFLFTDIEASTRLAQVLGEGYRRVLQQHRTILRETIGRYEGAELLTEGDSFFVAFPDASAALRACLDAQRAIARHLWPAAAHPRVRMGLHTGYAVPYGGEYASQEVHRAARVASAAHGGQVLCSAATTAQAGELPDAAWLLDLGLHRLRGFDDTERLYQLVAPGLERHFPRPRTVGSVRHNLPASATSFVGRVPERAELRALVLAHRLVTVSGPGGAGKTRLAVAVAGDLTSHYPDGVWFSDLATANDPALLPVSVAAAFGLRPEPGRPIVETLAEHVRQQRCLLLLDTCEHQRDRIASLVSQLLAACPLLSVACTSREPLGLAGEVVWRIPPMSVTPPRGGTHGDAVELLIDRATAARGGHPDLSSAELPDLERVARRLDGLPLALELAAARLRMLSAGELAERLDDVLGVLDGPRAGSPENRDGRTRHGALTTTVDWSYRTLGTRSARLLRWMSAFAGGVGLDTIERLLGEPALAPLAVLVDKSLVQAEGGPRRTTYRMLDTIRAYAARKLVESGEEPTVRGRHVRWCLDAVRQAVTSSDGAVVTSLYALDPLAEEVRRALHWEANHGGAHDGLRLVAALDPWWRERGHAREARVWLFRLYQRISEAASDASDPVLTEAYHVHALLAGADGEHAEQVRFSQRAELLARRVADPALLARVMSERGEILTGIGSPGLAEQTCRDTIRDAREHGTAVEALPSVYCLARLLWRRGESAEARQVLAAAEALESGHPSWRGLRQTWYQLGLIALTEGELDIARCYLVKTLRARMLYGFHSGVVSALYAMASWAVRVCDHDRAALLIGAADTHRDRLRVAGTDRAGADLTTAEEELGAAYAARHQAGARLDLAEAVQVAVAVPTRRACRTALAC